MTRKHYVALAKALALSRPTIAAHTRTSAVGNNTFVNHITFDAMLVQWIADREVLMGTLNADNPRFDRERFIAATEA